MLRAGEHWLGRQRTAWESRLDRLGDFLAEPPAPRKGPRHDRHAQHVHAGTHLRRPAGAGVRRLGGPGREGPLVRPRGTHELDFRVGGARDRGATGPDGIALAVTSTYHDIVPEQRIVYSTTLSGGEALATVSITTVELAPTATAPA